MQSFYSSLERGESKAEALRSAQISLIQNDGSIASEEEGERGVARLCGHLAEQGRENDQLELCHH